MSHFHRKGRGRSGSRVAAAVRVLPFIGAAVGLPFFAPFDLPAQGTRPQPATPQSTSDGARFEGPLVLRLPASARLLGMANAGAAAADGDAVFYNPGMLPQARGVAVSAQRYGARATSGSFGSVQTFGAWSIGLGAQLLQYQGDAADPVGANDRGGPRLSDGGTVTAASTACVFGVARIIKGVRVGASAKYAEERLDAIHDGGVALDVGVSKPLGPATLAMAVQNIGSDPDLDVLPGALPTRFTVGYGGGLLPLWEHWDLGMQTQVSVERDGFVRPAGGVELGYVPIEGVAVIVRSGLRLPRERDEPLATAGFGLNVDRFSFEWAVEPMRGGRPVVHRVGIRLR
ncbi:MAG: hypothetical protein ACK57A_01310 [Gemmatimonas sp.]|uniref:hypothetical protein n=1 Tax=Gemmatimonas sp. TaxID=1962908 RepID=UPI00391EECD5